MSSVRLLLRPPPRAQQSQRRPSRGGSRYILAAMMIGWYHLRHALHRALQRKTHSYRLQPSSFEAVRRTHHTEVLQGLTSMCAASRSWMQRLRSGGPQKQRTMWPPTVQR